MIKRPEEDSAEIFCRTSFCVYDGSSAVSFWSWLNGNHMFGKNCLEYDREKDIIGEIRKTGRTGEGGKES